MNSLVISINGKPFFVHPCEGDRYALNIEVGTMGHMRRMPPLLVDAGTVIDVSSQSGDAVFEAKIVWNETATEETRAVMTDLRAIESRAKP